MIRHILIIGSSGLPVFFKEFQTSPDGSGSISLGGLITTIIEQSRQTTGFPVSSIEFTNVLLTIISHEPTKLRCALFTDRDGGRMFGRLLCSEILNSFVQNYPSEMFQQGTNLKDFVGFIHLIPSVIYYSVRPILMKLESTNGIFVAVVAREHEIITNQRDADIEALTILSCIPTMIDSATHLMLEGNDFVQNISIDTNENERLLMWKIRDHLHLIIVVDTTVKESLYSKEAAEALELMEKLHLLHEDFLTVMSKEK